MTQPPTPKYFLHFPYLTKGEFSEVCHHLDRRYRHATLGPLRRLWHLNLLFALDQPPTDDASYRTYIQIVRPLEDKADRIEEEVGLSAALEGVSLGGAADEGEAGMEVDREMIEAEEADQEALHTVGEMRAASSYVSFVTYEIHLHETYRLPCLWFSLSGLPVDESPLDIDTVFRRLVPDQFKRSLRDVGPTGGGISMGYHPVTGVPCFFVHPCRIGDAMEPLRCDKDKYLISWMGIVGAAVGLWVPKELMMVDDEPCVLSHDGT